jgi:hypothetical protein
MSDYGFQSQRREEVFTMGDEHWHPSYLVLLVRVKFRVTLPNEESNLSVRLLDSQ